MKSELLNYAINDTINDAIQVLSVAPAQSGAVSRELLVAYATLAAWTQHWPSRATLDSRRLVEAFAWVRDIERDRYIKQRRIAIARLAKEENL